MDEDDKISLTGIKEYKNRFIGNWPEGITDSQKKLYMQMMDDRAKRLESLCVIYTPDCGCEIEQDVVLDRYPMSPKIMNLCPSCGKGCLSEISDPIRFYLPFLEQEYSLQDLKDMYITNSPQKFLIEAYRDQKIEEE